MDSLSFQSLNGRSTKACRIKNHKSNTPFEFLCNESEQINPAILLAEELMRKDIAEILDFDDLARAEKTLAVSRREIEAVASGFEALIKTPAVAASEHIPIGF
ncbi:MAG TPA: hypothetical protein PKE69_16615 [Pyrinomonadaceae bacterium]|nr:hypothetical protein [Pyrinomonadaceae bacterium]